MSLHELRLYDLGSACVTRYEYTMLAHGNGYHFACRCVRYERTRMYRVRHPTFRCLDFVLPFHHQVRMGDYTRAIESYETIMDGSNPGAYQTD